VIKSIFINLSLLFTFLIIPLGWAADHFNLEEGLPTRVEDAYPIAFRGREVQGLFRYEQEADDRDKFTFEPRLEFGIAPNAQLTLHTPFFIGNADREGSGDLKIGGLYNFNTESINIPAFAIAAEGEIPTGKESRGLDTTLKLITTKSISDSGLDRLHLNLAWIHNAGNRTEEREHRYSAILGYSRRLGPDTILVGDFVREQQREEGKNSNIFEIGVRQQITPLTVGTIGVGTGIGEDSPDIILTVGFQQSF
jgi:hypothetical protein